jgi:hypothetical protein
MPPSRMEKGNSPVGPELAKSATAINASRSL